jgi:hypothetical protein
LLVQLGVADYLHKPLCYEAVWKIWQHCLRQRLRKARGEQLRVTHNGEVWPEQSAAPMKNDAGCVQPAQPTARWSGIHQGSKDSERPFDTQPQEYELKAENVKLEEDTPPRSATVTPPAVQPAEPLINRDRERCMRADTVEVKPNPQWSSSAESAGEVVSQLAERYMRSEELPTLPIGLSLTRTPSLEELAAVM